MEEEEEEKKQQQEDKAPGSNSSADEGGGFDVSDFGDKLYGGETDNSDKKYETAEETDSENEEKKKSTIKLLCVVIIIAYSKVYPRLVNIVQGWMKENLTIETLTAADKKAIEGPLAEVLDKYVGNVMILGPEGRLLIALMSPVIASAMFPKEKKEKDKKDNTEYTPFTEIKDEKKRPQGRPKGYTKNKETGKWEQKQKND